MEFHPYAETFDLLEGTAYEEFRADIAANGCREPVKYRLVAGKRQGLDGRNRLRACKDLELPCPEIAVEVDDESVVAYIDSLNVHRRHLSRETQQVKRAERVKRVAEKRAQGQSYRAIAESEGISDAQARRDAQTATAPGGAVDPPDGKVTGRDGKKRPARKPKPAATPKPPKAGTVLYPFNNFETSYGALLREIDALGNCYKAKESSEAKALRKQLGAFREAFTAWHGGLTK